MKTDIEKTKRSDFIEMCKNIIGTDEILYFENATGNFVKMVLNIGLTVRYCSEGKKVFDIEVLDEPDGPWNYFD